MDQCEGDALTSLMHQRAERALLRCYRAGVGSWAQAPRADSADYCRFVSSRPSSGFSPDTASRPSPVRQRIPRILHREMTTSRGIGAWRGSSPPWCAGPPLPVFPGAFRSKKAAVGTYAASQKLRLNFRKRSSPPPPFRPAPTITCPSSFSMRPAFHNRSRAIATTRASPPPSRRCISPTLRQEPSSNSNIFSSKDREVLVRLDIG
jgi:hypothetical protein